MPDEEIVFDFDQPTKASLIDEIRSLSKANPKPVKEEPEPILFGSKKKNKKKKNKKGISSSLDVKFIGDRSVPSYDQDGDGEETNDSRNLELLDIDRLLYGDEDESSVGDPIINEQLRGYEKRKNDSNKFKKEFAEELTLLYDVLDELNKFGKELDRKYRALESSKVRGVSKYTSDLITNILSAKTNKLQIIKEIANIKKTYTTMKINQEAKSKNSEGAASVDAIASQYLYQAMASGRQNYVKSVMDQHTGDDSLNETLRELNIDGEDYSDEEMDQFNDILENRLENENNPFRTERANKYIEYEKLEPKLIIKKCIDNGEWNVIAIDKDNQEIHGYPVPDKASLGKVKFSDDVATDQKGRMYRVQEYYSSEMYYEED